MHNTTPSKRDNMTMTLAPVKGRGVNPPPCRRFKDKRRKARSAERAALRKGD